MVGAIVELGLCLDLMDQGGIELVRTAFDSLASTLELIGEPLPVNHGPSLLRRNLDNAVIKRVHTLLEASDTYLDTIRGVFVEGQPIYPGAGFDAKTHIQICVCNPRCIKGVFRVPPDQLSGPAA